MQTKVFKGFLLSHKDSNLDRQIQKLQCYHYTMRQLVNFPLVLGKSCSELKLTEIKRNCKQKYNNNWFKQNNHEKQKTGWTSALKFNRYHWLVVSLGFEPGQAEPKTAVLPLHHETIGVLFISKAVQRYDCFSFWQ